MPKSGMHWTKCDRLQCSDVVADILKKAAAATPGSKKAPPRPPPLQVLFHVGQLVRAVVVDLTEAPSGDSRNVG